MSKITSHKGTTPDDEFADWINTAEAAQILGVSQRWIRDLLEAGELEGRKLGLRFWYVKRSSVEDYRKKREQGE